MSERTNDDEEVEEEEKKRNTGVRVRESERPVWMCAHKQINNTPSYVASLADE